MQRVLEDAERVLKDADNGSIQLVLKDADNNSYVDGYGNDYGGRFVSNNHDLSNLSEIDNKMTLSCVDKKRIALSLVVNCYNEN